MEHYTVHSTIVTYLNQIFDILQRLDITGCSPGAVCGRLVSLLMSGDLEALLPAAAPAPLSPPEITLFVTHLEWITA